MAEVVNNRILWHYCRNWLTNIRIDSFRLRIFRFVHSYL